MRKAQQLDFFNYKKQVTFGGENLKGKRKSKRPLSTKKPIHLQLKADKSCLRKRERFVIDTANRLAAKFGVKIYRLTVNSNHIHALIRIHSRELYNRFIQALTGLLARKLSIKWLARPFTRLVEWGKAFRRACNYIEMNWYEAMGFIEHQPRGRGSLKKRPWWSGATT